MATPFSKIYKRFLHQIEDADLLEATDETIKELLFNYLEDSIVEFEYRCDKSLEFEFPCRDSIKLNVKDNKAIINNCYSENLDLEIFCVFTGIKFFKDIDYKLNYDKETKDMEIVFINNSVFDEIIVEFDFEGEFKEDLNNTEQYILTLGMLIHWISPKINLEENLSNVLTDKDYKQLSPANMLFRLTEYKKQLREELEIYIQRYNFKDFGGF